MWTFRDFSIRKFKRKVQHVGYRNASLSAAELASRKILLSRLFAYLCANGTFTTLSPTELQSNSETFLNFADENEYARAVPAPFVATFERGYVLTESGLITTEDGRILNEGLFPQDRGRRFVVAKLIWQLFHDSARTTTALLRKDLRALDARASEMTAVAPLIPRYSDNYYHWLIETLPQIRYLRNFESETGIEVTYLVPDDAPSWLEETLSLLDVPDTKIEYASEDVYRVNDLIVPSFPIRTYTDYDWIVETILSNAEQESVDAGHNVYISRANAIERRVVNEDAVMETLSEYGFERHALEESSVAENVQLFREAELIVGAHGAGLTDLIFCKDATVIELFGSKIKDPYERLAETMGVEYDSIQCTPSSTDLIVDTESLADRVETHR